MSPLHQNRIFTGWATGLVPTSPGAVRSTSLPGSGLRAWEVGFIAPPMWLLHQAIKAEKRQYGGDDLAPRILMGGRSSIDKEIRIQCIHETFVTCQSNCQPPGNVDEESGIISLQPRTDVASSLLLILLKLHRIIDTTLYLSVIVDGLELYEALFVSMPRAYGWGSRL
ncbi:hypothetical protein BD779DRAFT_1469088 [Infundibulicybe gibba]|nr:hypothetical protein BD779DRAFT_1469088 [Infundibulicybe gibba]